MCITNCTYELLPAKESNDHLRTVIKSDIIEKRGDSSHFVLLKPYDVSENLQFTKNSKKEDPVEKLLKIFNESSSI